MHVDRDDLDTGAGDQDASDGTEDTMPLTHTFGHTVVGPSARMEIFDCVQTACSDLRVTSMKIDGRPFEGRE